MEAVLFLLLDAVSAPSRNKAFLAASVTSLSSSQIDHIRETVTVALESFQLYIHEKLARYSLHRNTVGSKSYELPVELLSHILRLSVPLEDWSVERLQELAQVSRRWKDIVTSTPKLWAVAKVTNHQDPSGLSWRTHLDLALRMSHNSPLSVFHINQERPDYDSLSSDIRRCEEFMTIVGRHTARWKSVHYSGHRLRSIVSALERPCPSLEDLSVVFDRHLEGSRMRIIPGARLRHITLDHAELEWRALLGLHSLRIRSVAERIPQARELLVALRACPQLEVLELSSIDITRNVDEDERFELNDSLVKGPSGSDERLYLPRLTTLQVRDVDGGFFRALIAKVHGENVRCMSLRAQVPLPTTLSETDPSFLISPTLDTVAAQKKRLYITVFRTSVVFHSDADPDSKVPEVGSPCSFNFELCRRPVYIDSDDEIVDVATILENAAMLLDTRTLPAPLHVRLGRRGAGDDRWTFTLPFTYLKEMPTLTELQIHPNLANASSILESLSKPIRNDADELMWPCPQLAHLYVDVTQTNLLLELLALIEDRCCGDISGYPSPIPLSTLTLRVRNHQPFANLVGVGELIFVD
ncbi:hypothetical protein FRB96_001868 [Tulasnella sp. 330]|nr:hypothetical protein FRB96_001868 [Tulasnella sp. 330]